MASIYRGGINEAEVVQQADITKIGVDSCGDSPLHKLCKLSADSAALCNDVRIVVETLGVDPSLPNADGFTARDILELRLRAEITGLSLANAPPHHDIAIVHQKIAIVQHIILAMSYLMEHERKRRHASDDGRTREADDRPSKRRAVR